MSSARQRDVLPMPPFELHSFDRNCLSRCSIRRLTRKNKILSWANEGIGVLNQLGCGQGTQVPLPSSHLSQGTFRAREHVAKAYGSLERPPDSLSSEGALSALLANAGFYSDCRNDILPYAQDKVSWPARGSKPVSLVDGLAPADRKLLHNWDSYMLRDSDDYHTHISTHHVYKPYCDPELMRDPTSYGKFLQRLHDAGMLRWRVATEKQGALGIFFVKKKDGSLRLIFDTRKLNLKFKDPPKTELPTSAALSQIEGPAGCDLLISAGDIRNAFYAFEVPEGLSDMFTLPLIDAQHANVHCIDGIAINPDTLLTPCLTVLPMGWNWSLHLCQSYTSNVVKRICGESNFFSDRSGSKVVSDAHSVICTTYVDNYAVFGANKQAVNSCSMNISKAFIDLGLQVHEQVSATNDGEFIGLRLHRNHLSVKPSRIWKVRFALMKLVNFRRVSGKVLEIIVGHITWIMLIRRESLSLLQDTYKFIHQHKDSFGDMPPTVRKELMNVSAILPLLRVCLTSQWDPRVHASDASSSGLGVCSRLIDPAQAGNIGRISEK